MQFFRYFFISLCAILSLHIYTKSEKSEEFASAYEPPSYDDFRNNLNIPTPEADLAEEKEPLPEGRKVSDKDLLVHLAPLLVSRSVERVGTFLKNEDVVLPQRLFLLDTIMGDTAYGFSHEDAIQLVLDVANSYPAGSREQDQFFGILLKYADLLKAISPLFIAIDHEYSNTYVPLLVWSVKNAAGNPAVENDLKELKKRALVHAADLGKSEVIDKIHKFTPAGVTREEATDLVWHIITSGNHPELLPKLKELNADLNSTRGKTTPLIEATERDDAKAISQLIDLRVDLDKFADPDFGTALQRAIIGRKTEIEKMLRDAGARE